MSLNVGWNVKENVLLVRLSGELDHHEAGKFKKEWQHMIQTGEVKHVILNLADLTFMDSSGLGVILGRYKELKQMGGEMIACSISPLVERLFELSGLFKIIRYEENEMLALLRLGVAS
ncbi:anti-sigma F factor antagonist [Paraliobacillus ryukyuensis]|uniref:anti-sigma F factor antagonist n=1 Tax=Paraliobacillus ryukyuensis TaxID=200904 RepID=UPI0009A657E5|nr:anti-sigma F factor antagonist [Paraliobacillus ryukyuensis]